MPELPSVAALAERIAGRVGGRVLERATLHQFSALKTFDPALESLAGREVASVGHRGKFLVFDLAGPRLLVHLSQGGRVELEDQAKATRPKGAVLRLAFSGAGGILVREYGTERKAGVWVLAPGDDGPLAALGPDATSPDAEAVLLAAGDRRRVHTILRDQRTLAGVGRGWADDILHAARLSPYATLAGLGGQERERLVVALREVLAFGLAAERRRTGGLPPKLGEHFRIHGRAGTPCPRCGADLRRVSYESHEVAYCPPCQTGGKVLADRRLSRLVR